MSELDLSKINQVPLDTNEYIREVHPKLQIVLHHTAGNSSGVNTIKHWNNDSRGRIATCVCISNKGASNSEDGQICQAFSSKYWAYHLGLKKETFNAFNLSYMPLDKTSIGIELCAWGYLTEKNGKFYSWANTEIPKDEVCVLEEPYKNRRFYHKYSDAQIESVRQLLVFWNKRYDIPIDYNECNMWDLSRDALSGKKGVYTHNSYRSDKSDVFPQPSLIKMLKTL